MFKAVSLPENVEVTDTEGAVWRVGDVVSPLKLVFESAGYEIHLTGTDASRQFVRVGFALTAS